MNTNKTINKPDSEVDRRSEINNRIQAQDNDSESVSKKYWMIFYRVILVLTFIYLCLSLVQMLSNRTVPAIVVTLIVYLVMISVWLSLIFGILGMRKDGKEINKERAGLLMGFTLVNIPYILILTSSMNSFLKSILFIIIAIYILSLPLVYKYFQRPPTTPTRPS